jgi:hypothetical protein
MLNTEMIKAYIHRLTYILPGQAGNDGIRRLCLKYCAPSSLPRMGEYILTSLDKEIK